VSDGPILSVPQPWTIREELQALILGELLGPAGGSDEEVGEARLIERYVLGMLAPQRVRATAEENDKLAVEGDTPTEEGESEPESLAAPTMFPSSCGMTFCVEGDVSSLVADARWGRYKRQRSERAGAESRGNVWKRFAAGGSIKIPLAEADFGPESIDGEQPDVVVRGRVRRLNGDWLVSLFLVNGQAQPERSRDEAWLFQVELSVSDPGGRAVFVKRPPAADVQGDDPDWVERRQLAMLYRDKVEFAAGHGIAVHAEPSSVDPRHAVRIETRAVPACDIARTDPPNPDDVPELSRAILDMAVLSGAAAEDLGGMLQPLVSAYESWIAAQRARLGDPGALLAGFEDVAEGVLGGCRVAAERIRRGIELLATSPDAAEAFRFANRAMWLQRVHSLAALDRRRDPSLGLDDALAARDVPENRTWYPFQLAFILLNLPAMTDPTHPERGARVEGLVDLLWFPTGGGKTEAYLGLVAYAIAIRRFQGVVSGHDGGDGVAAIMRYTLRLLTIQQFQRASALIAACEVIRRERREKDDDGLGDAPIRIGLWVGNRATPNNTDDAEAWVKQQRGAAFTGGQAGSPAQLTFCPWCGSEVNPRRDIEVEMTPRRTLLYCGDKYGTCPFTKRQAPLEGLPVLVVDEEIYRHPPALLIGTVDKFAQMPWRGPIANLFGRVSERCERHGYRAADLEDADSHPKRAPFPAAKTVPAGPLRPPDLIIQDELHLISGPLGSMVGLYETAVDSLCSWTVDGRDVRPKVIASTATVRRAPFQAYQLFWRGLMAFPPPGLDAGDSFWALQREPSEENPGRRYLGICAHGRQFKSVLIRVFVAQMAAAQTLYEKYGRAVDPYMTVVGYFNALKDLGGMRRHVEDEVSSRLGRIDQHGLARRQRPFLEELTSRRGSADIPRILDQLAVPFDPTASNGGPKPIDVLLATNMISVGIDVPRLGAMIVAGQPKATAEYIQATSRVGRERDRPGLVLTVYGWARPRDISHYERFEHYHATFYSQVEALSVTPFADRARDRGLSAVLVGLLRQHEPPWNPEEAAHSADTHAEEAKRVLEYVAERASGVMGDDELAKEVRQEIRQEIQARLDAWDQEQHVPGRKLAYRSKRDGVTQGLLRSPDIGDWRTFTTPTSLRNVEPGINLLLLQSDLGEGNAPAFEFAPQKAASEEEEEETE